MELEPKIAATWIALVAVLQRQRCAAQADKVIAEVSQKIPAQAGSPALAQCYEAMQDFDAAQKQYQVALAAASQDPVVVRAAADFYVPHEEVGSPKCN